MLGHTKNFCSLLAYPQVFKKVKGLSLSRYAVIEQECFVLSIAALRKSYDFIFFILMLNYLLLLAVSKGHLSLFAVLWVTQLTESGFLHTREHWILFLVIMLSFFVLSNKSFMNKLYNNRLGELPCCNPFFVFKRLGYFVYLYRK